MIKQEEIQTEQEQILTFHEEGEVSREIIEFPLVETRKLKDLDDVLANDIKGFLMRPIKYADFEWLATNTDAVELIKEISLPRDWISQKMIREKLQGFRYLRCDFKIRVQVNAQPFNAGYLLLTFLPLHRQNQMTPSNVSTFSGITGYRRVMLDLNEDTSAELVVPFSGMIDAFELVHSYGYLGVVKLYVYSPLTGLDNVDGTVWITADNVEVMLPTGLDLPVPTLHSGPAHAGPVTKKDQNLKTNSPKKKGQVSAIADTVGQVAGALKDVPVIGSVASTVEWASSAVSSVASFFGFSKPTDEVLPCKETLVVGNNLANYDGDSKAKSLAFFSQNETEMPVEVFGTEQDEMSFSHILAQPVYLERFKMSNTNKQGDIIWQWPVDPLSCRKLLYSDPAKTPFVPGAYVCQNTYLSYLSNFFKFYRGTIKYHIRVIKTAFHSGRIRILVVPGATPLTKFTDIDFNKVHSVVYDLRDTTKFDIEVPYKWNTPWKAIDGLFLEATTTLENATPNTPTAMVYIQVVNALRNPSTAANTIDFIVETSAGDDFQFAVPMVNTGVQLVVSEEALRQDYPASSGPAHSGAILDNAGGEQLIANKVAVGEVVTGWRTLLKRYARWLKPEPVGHMYHLLPYGTLAQYNRVKSDFDLFSACELLYRFRSGALRVAAKTMSKVSDAQVVIHEVAPHDSSTVQTDTVGAVVQSEFLEPLVELSVPFYQETVALPTNLGIPGQSDTADWDLNFAAMPYNQGTFVRSDKELEWWRSTAEDFSFGYLVGPPKTIINHAASKCNDSWRAVLATLFDKTKYPYGPATNDKWAQARMFVETTLKTVLDPVPGEVWILYNQIFGTATYNAYMEHDKDPPESGLAQQYLGAKGKDLYNRSLNTYTRICIL